MPPLPLPAFIWAPSQTPEAKLATLAPEIQAAAAELKRLGYTLSQASAPANTRGVVELKHPGSPYTLVVVFQPAQVKLHLNVPLSDALYDQSETLKKQLATAFPGLEQLYLGSSDGRNIANLSFTSTVATPPKAWYRETLTTLQRAAEQLVGKPSPELDTLALDDAFKASIQEHLRVLAANRFTVSKLEKKDSSALNPPYFVQLLAKDTHSTESTIAFFFQEKVTLYSTSAEFFLAQPRELAERELKATLQRQLPETRISFFASLDKPGTSTLKLAYPISAQGRLSLLQQLESLHTARLLAQKTPVVYSTKEQELLSKLSSNAFQRSVIEQVKRGGWRIDNAYAFTREKDPPGVYLAVSRSEAPKPNAALPPVSLKVHHSTVELDAIGFVPAKNSHERLAFQEQLQKTYPAFRVTVLSSALTPGYDRIVFVLPEPMTALDVPHKLWVTLQRLQEAVDKIH
ncbi:hypothetical protein [Armatimonas rosea]|uniref:Uncharacterized protein n=1 Tax=Armatimonas rosea TaxID=685828 RepID=A0A7W9SMV7_ARMRO|nr:hypothetical protein [Armatimonas rosea]MBB6048878.1 hypothetical protein [Armatimonas rosea]